MLFIISFIQCKLFEKNLTFILSYLSKLCFSVKLNLLISFIHSTFLLILTFFIYSYIYSFLYFLFFVFLQSHIISLRHTNLTISVETQQSSYNILFRNRLFHAFMQSSVWSSYYILFMPLLKYLDILTFTLLNSNTVTFLRFRKVRTIGLF